MRKGITRIPSPYDLNAIMPFLMKRRCDSQVFYNVDFNVEPLSAHLEKTRRCTFFQAMLLALVKTMRRRPGLNRFIIGRRLYQREDLDISFVARRSLTDEGSETSIKMRIKADDDDDMILKKITGHIGEAKEGAVKGDDKLIAFLVRLPRFMLRIVVSILTWLDFHLILPKDIEILDPLHCSAFIANLGSVGIEAPFHHLYEWGTCSLFVAIGKIGDKPAADGAGGIKLKKMVEVKVTLDERIADGYYFARALDIFKEYIEHPETLFAQGADHNSNKQEGDLNESV